MSPVPSNAKRVHDLNPQKKKTMKSHYNDSLLVSKLGLEEVK